MEITLKFKKLHPDAVTPSKAHPTDAGFDLVAISERYDREHDFFEYDTGISVEIPPGYVGLLAPRSSVSKTGLHMANSVGTIDAPYRGPIKARFYKNVVSGLRSNAYSVGDKIAQLIIVPIPTVTLEEVKDLSETDRGTGGFGSSGK